LWIPQRKAVLFSISFSRFSIPLDSSPYSERRASTGDFLEAFRAGKNPKTTEIPIPNAKASIIVSGVKIGTNVPLNEDTGAPPIPSLGVKLEPERIRRKIEANK